MEHISIGVYDYERNKLCDLYDSFIQAEGQAYNIVYTQELNGWQELTFNLPFVIESERNFRWDYIKSEYLVRMELGEAGEHVEWFVLQKPKASKNSKSISNTVNCPHLSTLLKTKNIYLVFDDETGIGTIDELMTRALTNTGWTLGECDTLLERDGVTEKIRSLKSDGKKGAYQLVIDICNLFKAYPIYHGDTKTVDIHALTNKGPMSEMYIGKNLNAISIEQATDNIITRLYVEGEYGDFGYVGIDDMNPTGLSYLMNFDYYKSIGLFTDTHQAAYDAYLADMLAVITSIKNKQQAILTAEDRLNTLWGQINYVVYELSNRSITKTITGGTVTDEQKQIVEGDELYVLKATGNYRVITAGSGGRVTFASNDILAAKFVTLPNGLIGAKQVAIESKEKVVATLTRDKNNQVDPLKQANIQAQIDANNAAIQELYTGYSSYTLATGGYFITSGATVDMTGTTADLGWKNCIVECQPGDVFYITGHGGTDQRLWCFVDATDSDIAADVLSASAASAVGTNTAITAPANTTHLICNFDASYTSALKKHILSGDGLYEEMREAIELAVTLDGLKDDLVELQEDQLEIEATFAAAMGDMLRDGYWSDTNYAPGQEESLYLDALDVIEQMSKPTVTYTFSQVALSEAMGYTETLPEINDKVTVWDEELKLYDIVYVSKRTQYLDNLQKDTVEVTNDDPALSGQSFESVLSRMSQLADRLQQKNTMYERAGAINANGSIYIDRLNGTLNVMKNRIGSSIGSWYTDDKGGIVFESAAGDSAMMLNGAGLLIANGKTQDGDWNWRTAIDGQGIVADRITTGYLSADRIEVGTISAAKLTSDVGDDIDISNNASITFLSDAITSEVSRASEAEGSLSTRITQTAESIAMEVTRATEAEGSLSSRITQTAESITTEVTRATEAEGSLSSRIQQTAESISTEVTRATEAEGSLSTRITQTAESIVTEVTRATEAEGSLSTRITQTAESITTEVTRATGAEGSLSSRIQQTAESIATEVTRATEAEGSLSSRIQQTAESITTEVTRATEAEGSLSTRITQTAESITTEVTRATAAEGSLSSRIQQTADSITTEVTRATAAEGSLSSRITQNAESITLAVTKVDNMSVGGTNLLSNSEGNRSANQFRSIDVKDILEDHIGEEICVSFDIKGTIARQFAVYPYQNRGISIANTKYFTMPTTDFQRFSFVTKVKDWGLSASGTTQGAIAWYDSAGQNPFTLRRIKIELGNMPTDWTPAPEDPVETLANTVVTIDTAGVAMTGGVLDFDARSEINFHSDGKFNVFATDDDSAIKFGGTEQNPNFSLGAGGTVKAVNGYFDNLIVQNTNLLSSPPDSLASSLVVSATQPSGHGIIWIQPTGSGSNEVVDYNLQNCYADMSGQNPTQTVTGFARQGSAVTGSTCTYGVRFKIYNYSGTCWWTGVTVQLQRGNGTGNPITIYQQSYDLQEKPIYVGDYLNVDTLNSPSGDLENLTDASSLKMIVTINKTNGTYARFEPADTFVIRCKGTGGGTPSAVQSCNVFFIP